MFRFASFVVLTAVFAFRSGAQEAPAWPDTYVARLQALALVQTLNAEVLASRSATATLEAWCRDHRLAEEPSIKAEVMVGVVKAATDETRQRLQVESSERVNYRRVRLRCGAWVLSEADNWYVPARLTESMNRFLETTDMPFGRVVQALEPYRRTVSVKVLWSPLPGGWERDARPVDGNGALAIPDGLLEHRAVLYTRKHQPFSEVVEIYQRGVLAFAPPRL
jgi:chorismate-pyruvate lyase